MLLLGEVFVEGKFLEGKFFDENGSTPRSSARVRLTNIFWSASGCSSIIIFLHKLAYKIKKYTWQRPVLIFKGARARLFLISVKFRNCNSLLFARLIKTTRTKVTKKNKKNKVKTVTGVRVHGTRRYTRV